MTKSIWDVLSIAATRDTLAIKRAYAAKLKQTNPEVDGGGFQVLRAAYENALRQAHYAALRASQSESEAEQEVLEREPAQTETTEAKPVENEPSISTNLAESSSPQEPSDDILHQRARDALLTALISAADTGTLRRLLGDVLNGPAMGNLDTLHRTEVWLANVLMHYHPASEALFDPLVRHFRWTDDEDDWKRHQFLSPIFAWRAHLAAQKVSSGFLARIRDRRHEFHPGYVMLARPMASRSWLGRTWCTRRTRVVRRLLTHMALKAPLTEEGLDPGAVTWWRNRIARQAKPLNRTLRVGTRFGLAFLLVGIVLALIVALDPDTVSSLRARSLKSPQDRTLAMDSCRLSTLRAPRVAAPTSVLPRDQRAFNFGDNVTANEAIADCNRMLALAPESLLVAQFRAFDYMKAGEWPGAVVDFESILAVSPKDPIALYGQGIAWRTVGSTDRGNKLIASALAADPFIESYLSTFNVPGIPIYRVGQAPAPIMPARGTPAIDTPAKIVRHAEQEDLEAAHRYFGLPTTLSGKVELECHVGLDGTISLCLIVSENPFGTGMGDVAIKIARSLRGQPALLKGKPVDQAPVRITTTFVPAEQREGQNAQNSSTRAAPTF